MMWRRIYVASSWRNTYQPQVCKALLEGGHLIYDFRNPPNGSGFGWSEIDPEWQDWSFEAYTAALNHPRAIEGFRADVLAMQWADTCVLVMPSGRSAHIEAGWMKGAGKTLVILQPEHAEPELMYKLADAIVHDIPALLEVLQP